MKVYISIPITGRDIREVKAEIEMAKAAIRGAGHTPVSPLALDHQDPEFYEAESRKWAELINE